PSLATNALCLCTTDENVRGQSRSFSTSLVNRGHRRLSRPIPIRAFAVRANLWFLVPFARNPFVPAPLAAVSPNLHLRHRGDISSGGIYVKYVRYGCLTYVPCSYIPIEYIQRTPMRTVLEARQQRGLDLATTVKIVRKRNEWIVPSQSGKGRYKVRAISKRKFKCNCPDHE